MGDGDSGAFERLVGVLAMEVPPAPGGRYRHWQTLRYVAPPDGVSHREWWAAMKVARNSGRRRIPLRDAHGAPFSFCMPDPVLELLQGIDRDASGQVLMEDRVVNPSTRDRYVFSSAMEEAITSSQLEGAATTREVAREMIRSGRRPFDRSERMILNNFQAMRAVSEIRGEPLTPEIVFRLHRTIVDELLTEGADRHFLRTPGDRVAVYDDRDNTLLHTPPRAEEIHARMQSMCDFANASEHGYYLHPAVKAIILHFWLAYDHPFTDGNGRTARSLFYWSMLRDGYWLVEFFSISRIFGSAPSRYARAFLYTETDENDLTYFILFHLGVIRRAIDEMREYLASKSLEIREIESLLRRRVVLTHRQLALLGHALRHPGHPYTIESHQRSHEVSYQTARTDLLDLAKRGLLEKGRAGRAFVFTAPSDLRDRLVKTRPSRTASTR